MILSWSLALEALISRYAFRLWAGNRDTRFVSRNKLFYLSFFFSAVFGINYSIFPMLYFAFSFTSYGFKAPNYMLLLLFFGFECCLLLCWELHTSSHIVCCHGGSLLGYDTLSYFIIKFWSCFVIASFSLPSGNVSADGSSYVSYTPKIIGTFSCLTFHYLTVSASGRM